MHRWTIYFRLTADADSHGEVQISALERHAALLPGVGAEIEVPGFPDLGLTVRQVRVSADLQQASVEAGPLTFTDAAGMQAVKAALTSAGDWYDPATSGPEGR